MNGWDFSHDFGELRINFVGMSCMLDFGVGKGNCIFNRIPSYATVLLLRIGRVHA